MKSIFISHSHSNSEKARLLADILVKEGMSVSRIDEFVPGSDWQGEILSAIKRCSVFVALIDEPASNVMLELGYALGSAKQVLLVVASGVRIPFDIASFPVVRFDQFDSASLFAIVEMLRSEATTEDVPEKQFLGGRDRLLLMLTDPDYREQVSPRDFETYVFLFFQELGFEALQMPGTHDGGYDILLKDPSTAFKAVVEVKKYTKNSMLGVGNVRQLLGSIMLSEASCAILISTSGFSASARSMAKKAHWPILLLTLEELVASTLKSITKQSSGPR